MNIKLMAGLFLSPLMVHAQLSTAAQPQMSAAPVVEARLTSNDLPEAPPASVRVSSGIVAPKLIHQVPVEQNTISTASLASRPHEAMISMMIDRTGKPSNLRIVHSAGADLDSSILQAVKQYRYRPGMVSGQAVPAPVNLKVILINE